MCTAAASQPLIWVVDTEKIPFFIKYLPIFSKEGEEEKVERDLEKDANSPLYQYQWNYYYDYKHE